MKMNLKAVTSAFAGVCLITVMLSGCSQAGTSRSPGQYGGRQLQNTQTQGLVRNNMVNTTTQLRQGNQTGIPNPGTTLGNNPGPNLGMNQEYTPQLQSTPNRQKTDDIKRQLMKLNGVDNANVIVVGNTALVGCKLKNGTANSTAVRNSITNKIKEMDKTITNVTISESPNIMNRINMLGTDIGNKPAGTFMDEFNKLLKGVAPASQ